MVTPRLAGPPVSTPSIPFQRRHFPLRRYPIACHGRLIPSREALLPPVASMLIPVLAPTHHCRPETSLHHHPAHARRCSSLPTRPHVPLAPNWSHPVVPRPSPSQRHTCCFVHSSSSSMHLKISAAGLSRSNQRRVMQHGWHPRPLSLLHSHTSNDAHSHSDPLPR